MKEYVKTGSLWSVRKTWEARSYMLHVARNYLHSHRYCSYYEATGWRCQACVLQVREDQDHLSECAGYTDQRKDLNLDKDKDFLGQVMARRERQGWDRRSVVAACAAVYASNPWTEGSQISDLRLDGLE